MPSSTISHWFLDLLAGHYSGERPLEGKALRMYQLWLVEKIKEVPYIYLAVDMGLGKTIAVLTALIELEAAGDIQWPVLIVAPKLVASDTWPEEIADWAHTRHLTWSLIAGTAEERETARGKKANLHLIGYENFNWLREKWGRRWPYKTIVCDEATRLKAGKKRTKAGKGLRKDDTPRRGRRTSRFGGVARVRGILDRAILMSGTPAPQGLRDLWGPMYIVDQGERLGTSISAFEKRWFDRNPWAHTITPFAHSHAEIMELLKDCMFSMRSEDYLELPPLIQNKVMVRLPGAVMKRYKEFERTLYDEEFDVEAVSSGVLTNKLLQFANGSLYVDENTALPVHDLKVDALDRIVSEASGEPILLAYEFRFDLDRIMKRFPQARIIGDTKNWKKDWDAGRIPLLVTHPASAGHGLNLQFGSHIAVWFGLTWSLEYFQQFIKRLLRSGQRSNHVIVHYILAEGTVDEDVLDAMTGKAAVQDDITNAVRVRLQ